ncbi:hypothetical protein [Desulfobacula phenolica]|uniref:Uncharacterized protein n=1 Tax=Desulfobacula phenolica TaxID=90732 RepID=A0A1H2I3C1_9BACT|nr:hypothetical protein [Desulfobacula phenolica]SDU38298.1 hypothetical protein SAMN04487931_107194 [Desulfobacula phenolica]
MPLAPSANNVRYNGTGRTYAGAVGGSSFDLLGDLENLNFNLSVSTDKMKTNLYASRATILEVESEREASLSFGLREMTNENLKMALLSGSFNALNQSASYVYQANPTLAADLFIELGHMNVFSTKLTGVITGSLAVGDTVTGGTSAATGKIAFVGSGYVELVNVSGTFQTGEQVYETQDTNYITPSGIETLEDVVVTDSTGAIRRVQGTDYSLDPDYGYIRKLSTGSIADEDVASYDHEAVNTKYTWAMSASSVQKKLIFASDKNDQGPRMRWTFHKAQINLNGDFPLIGSGAAILGVNATVLADTTQPSGQEYFKTEIIG